MLSTARAMPPGYCWRISLRSVLMLRAGSPLLAYSTRIMPRAAPSDPRPLPPGVS